MKHAIGPRREMGVRTVFNILGPAHQPRRGHAADHGRVRQRPGGAAGRRCCASSAARRPRCCTAPTAWTSSPPRGPNILATLRDGQVTRGQLDPAEHGLPRATLAQLQGGDAAANAHIVREVLAGAPGPQRDVVLLNAALALVAASAAPDLDAALALAAAAIDSGRARQVLDTLVQFTQQPSSPTYALTPSAGAAQAPAGRPKPYRRSAMILDRIVASTRRSAALGARRLTRPSSCARQPPCCPRRST